MHRADVCKAAAGVDKGKLFSGIAFEEEQPRIALGGVGRFFGVGIYVVKNRFARRGAGAHSIHDLDGLIRIDVVIPRQAQIAKRIPAVIAGIHRKDQPAPSPESGVVDHVHNGCIFRIHFDFLRLPGAALKREDHRQRVIQVFLHGVKVVIAAVLLIKDVVLRRESLA